MGRKGVRQYDLIAGDLGTRIEAGELPPGTKLPTEPQLAEQYGVSRNAIRNALAVLRDQGLLEAKQGRGTFVVDRKPTDIEPCPADHPFIIRMPDPDEARQLGIRRREPVIEVYHPAHPIYVDLRGTAHKVFVDSPCELCSDAGAA